MELPEIADIARNFAVMIRAQGPDPKGLKMRNHSFHHYNSGTTTLSASGMILPTSLYAAPAVAKLVGGGNSLLVLTVASVIEPFLPLKDRDHNSQTKPELILGAHIDVLVERKTALASDCKMQDEEDLHQLPAELITLVDIPESSAAIQTLIGASSGSLEHGWEVGWSLASYTNGPQSLDATQTEDQPSSVHRLGQIVGTKSSSPSRMGKSTTRIALLGVSSVNFEHLLPNLIISTWNKRGDLLLAMGAPFGILSPAHFRNSISVGSIANCYPPSSSHRSLLMADIRCLPGMEGCPVFGEHAKLVGILTRPLRQRGSGAEVQLVIPWEAITTACSNLLLEEPQNKQYRVDCNNRNFRALGSTLMHNNPDSFNHVNKYPNPLSPSPVEKAMTSICLITVDDGVWASGVFLNDSGLILTNAHLFEPWRFRKPAVVEKEFQSNLPFNQFNNTEVLPKDTELGAAYNPLGDEHGKYKAHLSKINGRRIRVRLDHVDPWMWSDARVLFVSKGPLDVALMQLEFVPSKVRPITMDFTCPSPGSTAYVIGHGLFGPRSELLPSACRGVVAKVVKAKRSLPHLSNDEQNEQGFPAMIETTAAVHPGGSGGAVVRSDGYMIGLVTSNARYGGETVIPHLNFSIPCAALEPIFKFSKDMQDLSLLEDLDKPNEQLSSVWALMPPLSPKPPSVPNLPPVMQGDKSNDNKGSRFAKFMAERQQLLKNASQPGKVESIFTMPRPSKHYDDNRHFLEHNPTQRWETILDTSKHYVAGLLAGVATVITGHPFDTVKVKLQKHNAEGNGIKYKNGLHCTARILKTEGVKGLYRGATPSFAGMAFEGSLVFGIYTQTKQALQGGIQNGKPDAKVIIPSAAFGGSIISFILCPSELVKCRMQIQGADSVLPNSSRYSGPLDCAIKTIKSEGVPGIFRGEITTLFRESIGNAVFFTTYEYVRYYMHLQMKAASSDPSNLIDVGVGIVSGGIGGIAFWSAVLPLDVAKTIIQTSPDKSLTRNPFQILKSIYRTSGLRGCYTGLGPTVARAFPANATAIVTFELAVKVLGIRCD